MILFPYPRHIRRLRYALITLVVALCAGTISSQTGAQEPASLFRLDSGPLPRFTIASRTTPVESREIEQLGGPGLVVDFEAGVSFGMNNAVDLDWSDFETLNFSAFNTGSETLELNLNVIFTYRTRTARPRASVPVILAPGGNRVSIDLADILVSAGQDASLAGVLRWDLLSPRDDATIFLSELTLEAGVVAGQAAVSGPSGSSNGLPSADRSTPDRPPGVAAQALAAPGAGITMPVMFDTPEADAILSRMQVYPADNAFNQSVVDWPVAANSRQMIEAMGAELPLRYNPDMAFILVAPGQPRVEVAITDYPGESDAGPYPVPANLPIEGWPVAFTRGISRLSAPSLEELQRTGEGDRHAIVVDPVNRVSYEFFRMFATDDGWTAAQASIFDLTTNELRPDGWTSADAAGLPIFPAVVRHDEIQKGEITHALRVTFPRTRRAYVAPATHFASRLTDPDLPRMGERIRLRSDFDTSGFSAPVRTLLVALQRYGMLVADNGIAWAVSVTPDPRIPDLHAELRRVRGADFEVVVTPEP